VATATWQHCRGAALCIGKIGVNRSGAFGWEGGGGGGGVGAELGKVNFERF